MRWWLLSVVLLGCKKQPTEAPPPPVPAVPVAPAPAVPAPPSPPPLAPTVEAPQGADAMIRALSVRDPEPACAAVEALSEVPIEALRYVVDHVAMPPQAPMRAAGCLVPHHEAVHDDLIAWVTDPAKQGLGRLLLQRLEELPEPLAVEVIAAGRSGPLSEVVAQTAAEDPRAPVKAAAAP